LHVSLSSSTSLSTGNVICVSIFGWDLLSSIYMQRLQKNKIKTEFILNSCNFVFTTQFDNSALPSSFFQVSINTCCLFAFRKTNHILKVSGFIKTYLIKASKLLSTFTLTMVYFNTVYTSIHVCEFNIF
jgi:hypothetical protein